MKLLSAFMVLLGFAGLSPIKPDLVKNFGSMSEQLIHQQYNESQVMLRLLVHKWIIPLLATGIQVLTKQIREHKLMQCMKLC